MALFFGIINQSLARTVAGTSTNELVIDLQTFSGQVIKIKSMHFGYWTLTAADFVKVPLGQFYIVFNQNKSQADQLLEGSEVRFQAGINSWDPKHVIFYQGAELKVPSGKQAFAVLRSPVTSGAAYAGPVIGMVLINADVAADFEQQVGEMVL